MLLGAARFGCAEALIAELTESQPEMLARFAPGIPRMYDKAYRWVAEMEEISDFLEQNPPSRDIYAAIARLYDYLAAARRREGTRPRQRHPHPRPRAGQRPPRCGKAEDRHSGTARQPAGSHEHRLAITSSAVS